MGLVVMWEQQPEQYLVTEQVLAMEVRLVNLMEKRQVG
jgi:hypothetical protein